MSLNIQDEPESTIGRKPPRSEPERISHGRPRSAPGGEPREPRRGGAPGDREPRRPAPSRPGKGPPGGP
jgi:hypothetical protein